MDRPELARRVAFALVFFFALLGLRTVMLRQATAADMLTAVIATAIFVSAWPWVLRLAKRR